MSDLVLARKLISGLRITSLIPSNPAAPPRRSAQWQAPITRNYQTIIITSIGNSIRYTTNLHPPVNCTDCQRLNAVAGSDAESNRSRRYNSAVASGVCTLFADPASSPPAGLPRVKTILCSTSTGAAVVIINQRNNAKWTNRNKRHNN